MAPDPVLAEMHAINLAQTVTIVFGQPMETSLMVAFLPIMRRLVAGEVTADEALQGCLDVVPRRFLDVAEGTTCES